MDTVRASGLFDPVYYRVSNPDVALAGMDPLDHYITIGRAEMRRPSSEFDPEAYLAANPDIAETGLDPFSHYLEIGHREGRPLPHISLLRENVPGALERLRASGLFDEEFYLKQCPVVREARIDPLQHYLFTGYKTLIEPSSEILTRDYVAEYPDVRDSQYNPLLHWIDWGRSSGRVMPRTKDYGKNAIVASGLFDPKYYLTSNPDVVLAGVDPLDHYIALGRAELRRPSAEFDAEAYLAENPDVPDSGLDPLLHYLELGQKEGRKAPYNSLPRERVSEAADCLRQSGFFDEQYYLHQCPLVREAEVDPLLHYLFTAYKTYIEPSPAISTRAYLAQHPSVRESRYNPLLHWLEWGHRGERALPKPHDEVRWIRSAEEARYVYPDDMVHFERMAGVAFFSRFGLSFEPRPSAVERTLDAVLDLAARTPHLAIERHDPDVSIIIPVYGQLPFVLGCLDSLAEHRSRFTVEILVVDDASPSQDEMSSLDAIPWIRYERRGTNGGFVETCNYGAEISRGRFVVLLNSDTRVVEGWLDELIGSFEIFPKAGLVGSKLFNDDATLQEAGGIYWRDGSAWNYGRSDDASNPKYCFARRVDYCSGAAIAVPAKIWREMSGFDPMFAPAYCEDADLAFRLRDTGYEVWLQPLSRVLHYEGKTHGRDLSQGLKAHQVINQRTLRERWRASLDSHRPNAQAPDSEANRCARKRMLVIDALTPAPDRDSGSFITVRMLKAFQRLGYEVTFIPQADYLYISRYTSALQRTGIECLYAPFVSDIGTALELRREYDCILVYRYWILNQVYDILRRAIRQGRIIFHNVDLHYLREQREAELSGDRSLRIKAAAMQTTELEMFASAHCSIVHTAAEKKIVEEQLPLRNIIEFPYIAEVQRLTAGFAERRDILFLGGFGHPPNLDAVHFFVSGIWPRVRDKLPADSRFVIVGADAPDEVRKLASEHIVVAGYVDDLKPVFARSRVFVAPLRYGAGIKGKVIQSMAHGTPSVVTSIAAEGLGIRSGQEAIVADDPQAFAEAVLDLYNDPVRWNKMQEACYAFVEENFSWDRCLQLCTLALETADATWLAREDIVRRRRLKRVLVKNGHTDEVLEGKYPC